MNFGSNARSGADRIILRRRAEENKLAALQTAVQNNCHLGLTAKWEESSAKLMQTKQDEREEAAKSKIKELNLKIRKEKLKKLLAFDEIEYKKAIDDKLETPQQRRSRLEERAKQLRAKRIARRNEFVAKQKLKQFRNECDELRLNHGHNLNVECHQIRKRQMEEKKLQNQYDQSLNKQYLKIWQQELQKKIDRESRESEHKKKLNEETAKAIQEQMKALEDKRNQEKLFKQQQVAERVSKVAEAQKIEQAKLEKKMKDLMMKRAEMRKEYELFQQKKANQALTEKEMDKAFIQRVLAQEQAEREQQAEKSKGKKDDIENYLKYLEDLRQKEVENEKLLEKLRQNELEKEWNKRETQWKKEEFARQQLLKKVVDGRSDQIAYKQSMKEKGSMKDVSETDRLIKELEAFKLAEQKEKEERLKYNAEIQAFLKKQTEEKKKQLLMEKNDTAFDANAAEDDEMYNKLLKQEMEKDKEALEKGKSSHHFPRTTANWWTF